MITYHSVVLICADIEKSRKFYEDLFGLETELVIDGLVNFREGISLWRKKIASDLMYQGTDPSPPVKKPGQEIYFETDDIDGFFAMIQQKGTELLHPVEKTPWQQRTVRFFDPDGHLIEVGESMEEVIRGLGRQGKPAEEVAAMTCMPVEIIRAVLSGEQKH